MTDLGLCVHFLWCGGQLASTGHCYPWARARKGDELRCYGLGWGRGCMLEGCKRGVNTEWQTMMRDAFSCCAVPSHAPVRDLEVLTRKEKMLEKGPGCGRGYTCHSPQAPVSGMNMAWGLLCLKGMLLKTYQYWGLGVSWT